MIPICIVLVLLGLWHIHWAFGGTLGKAAVIPELNGTAIFALRALGEFRLLGFFKHVRGTRFVTMDSFVYAPLCLVLAVGIFATAWF